MKGRFTLEVLGELKCYKSSLNRYVEHIVIGRWQESMKSCKEMCYFTLKGTLILREINPKTYSKWYCLFHDISSTFITTQLFLTPTISHFWMWVNLHSVEIYFTVYSYNCSFGEESMKKVNPFQAHYREYLLRSSWRMITLSRNFEGWVNGGIIVSTSKIERVWNAFSGKPWGWHMCVWRRTSESGHANACRVWYHQK